MAPDHLVSLDELTEALPGARDFRLGTRDTHGCGDAVDRVEKPRAQRTTGNSS